MTNYFQTMDRIIFDAMEELGQISQSELNQKSQPDKWSKKEILGHLIDSAYNNHQRFLRASSQDNLIFQGYDQDDWVKQNNYQNRQGTEILNTWHQSQLHINNLIKNLPEDLLSKETSEHNFHQICMNPLTAESSSSLSYLVWDYVYHIEHHLSQIISDYRRQLSSYEK